MSERPPRPDMRQGRETMFRISASLNFWPRWWPSPNDHKFAAMHRPSRRCSTLPPQGTSLAQFARDCILFEDDVVIAVNKPVGLPSTIDGSLLMPLVMRLEGILFAEGKPNKVFDVHHLDRGASGAMIFTRSEKASHRIFSMFKKNAVSRNYLAVVEVSSANTISVGDTGRLTARLAHDKGEDDMTDDDECFEHDVRIRIAPEHVEGRCAQRDGLAGTTAFQHPTALRLTSCQECGR